MKFKILLTIAILTGCGAQAFEFDSWVPQDSLVKVLHLVSVVKNRLRNRDMSRPMIRYKGADGLHNYSFKHNTREFDALRDTVLYKDPIKKFDVWQKSLQKSHLVGFAACLRAKDGFYTEYQCLGDKEESQVVAQKKPSNPIYYNNPEAHCQITSVIVR